MKITIYIFCLFVGSCLYAQEKNEYEKSAKRTDFPHAAEQILQLIPSEATKLQFYKERDGEHVSFEVKFKHENRRYSVEFSKDGLLEDVEVTMKFRKLQQGIKESIQNDLDKRYNKWRIEKTQIQFTSKGNSEETKLNALAMKPDSQTGYEIIVATKNGAKISYFELQYDAKGTFRGERRVIRRSYDFVLF
ncbi:hypothetical protein J1N09_01125 [Aureitalea sp. L0-47]|uniref:hypothetical protein n=1 Tax=Aureitalea sp. L0-47 TaxID=2816962 RepID=UPI0022389C36|nr:hypothetical protein [Aureitalea sp. L0-47]MCW5518421.1 hypothetical protein [Aureitalea sp. L0-47]